VLRSSYPLHARHRPGLTAWVVLSAGAPAAGAHSSSSQGPTPEVTFVAVLGYKEERMTEGRGPNPVQICQGGRPRWEQMVTTRG